MKESSRVTDDPSTAAHVFIWGQSKEHRHVRDVPALLGCSFIQNKMFYRVFSRSVSRNSPHSRLCVRHRVMFTHQEKSGKTWSELQQMQSSAVSHVTNFCYCTTLWGALISTWVVLSKIPNWRHTSTGSEVKKRHFFVLFYCLVLLLLFRLLLFNGELHTASAKTFNHT